MPAERYFSHLNYTLTNEDTGLELDLLPDGVGHAFCVAGSGGRAIALLSKRPRRLSCADISREQLWLTRLRVETLRAFSHGEYLRFWGYPSEDLAPADRERQFAGLALPSEMRDYFRQLFQGMAWGPILYSGRWERAFATLSRINQRLTGRAGAGLFEARSLPEQIAYLERDFPWLAWTLVLLLLGNAATFNTLLYRGHFPRKNIPESHFRFYRKTFGHLFRAGLARENFFLQLAFFGEIRFAEGNPIECRRDVYERAREALASTEISYLEGDLIDRVRTAATPVDFLTCSDVPSYFEGIREREYLREIGTNLTAGARVLVRNYLRIPEADTTGFSDVTSRFRESLMKEKVGVYRCQVFEKRSPA